MTAQNPNLAALSAAGVSVWLDDLSRDRLRSGNLQELIDTKSVVGVTTNPSIFQKALSEGHTYDAQIAELAARGADVDATIRTVTTDDVRSACDVLVPQWEDSDGVDGRVSIEVDPRLAHETEKTIQQAIELWKIVDRPNLFIKIPATKAGLPAISAVLAEGISVNVTLIFSVQRYREVMDAYLTGMEKARQAGHSLSKIHSVASFFVSQAVFRIDHYLGKETVQNILALRFANQLFDPIWNAHYVDHVQITMAEDIGLGGRAGYYDGIGAARDVIQNHLMQLLALTAMEEPVSFHPAALQAEKIKVLSATRLAEPLDQTTSRGQYAAGWQGGEKVVGLLDEEGFAEDSTTETFAAITLEVDTRRWAGVPFYLRTGKRLGRRVTEIALVFRRAPHLPFDATMTDELGTNAMVIRVQPDEGVTLRFGSKVPGTAMEVRDVNMDFSYGSAFAEDSPEAYERLILDVLLGEPSLFPVNAEVELAWEILDPALEHWAAHGTPDAYEAGTWGPESSLEMLRRTGREWRRP
ncbi:glucose-6-phosphate dehydrogenase [Mycobacterium tuberculosis]|uniref:glucose-6-phosphate dehydrogenase n=4 Tax=Mycobacterium tuberculosis TaxID=1773 RepID=UPI0005E5E293|nr:glucose-6-phosphate dehydrogenase [Mycobacterium tuberculosis]CLR38053.1 Glucose-6-phosphate dehydrogenase [Mycobacterium tuberculosis]